jgi:hypothetical protein
MVAAAGRLYNGRPVVTESIMPVPFPFLRPAVLLVLPLLALSTVARADDVTPYRPSVSTPAQLPAVGQLEFEAGVLSSRTGSERRDSVPVLFKLAFSKEWGVLIGGDSVVQQREADGTRMRGLGDTNLTLKRAFVVDDATAYGLELSAKLPTARDAIGSGKADYTVNTIYSHDLGKLHLDANANLTRLGAPEPGTGRHQTGLAASFSLPVDERWSAVAELSGTHRAGEHTAQLLLAATWSPSKQLTFDAGMARGLTHDSPDWSLFTGVVLPLGHVLK